MTSTTNCPFETSRSLSSLTALLLGAVGIYDVVAYSVSRRTREMGIRMALGASAAETVFRIVRSGMGTVSLGLLLGVAGALVLGAPVSELLHDVDPKDPWVFMIVISVTTGSRASRPGYRLAGQRAPGRSSR